MPTKIKPRKGYKSAGTYNCKPLSEKHIKELSAILETPISDDAENQLQLVCSDFALNHHAIDNAVRPSEINAACDLIIKQTMPLVQTLKDLDGTTLDKIASQEEGILEIHKRLQTDLETFYNATISLVQRRKKLNPPKGRRRERTALEILMKELIPIFEEISNKNATSTFNESYIEGLFVTFTRHCIHAIQGEFIGDHAIVKAIQKALKNN